MSRIRHLPLAASCVALLMGNACDPEGCYGLEVGKEYELTVRDPKPAKVQNPPHKSCGPATDLFPGDRVKIRVTSETTRDSGDCHDAIGELVDDLGLQLLPGEEGFHFDPIGGAAGANVIIAGLHVDWQGCPGVWSIAAIPNQSDVFAGYVSEHPPVVIYRRFDPDNTIFRNRPDLDVLCSKQQICTDFWGGEIHQL